jgi:hypothetical protein
MDDPNEQDEGRGTGGSSDGDTQPDDTGATGKRGDLGAAGETDDAADDASGSNLPD